MRLWKFLFWDCRKTPESSVCSPFPVSGEKHTLPCSSSSPALLLPNQAPVTSTDLWLPDIGCNWTGEEERECMMSTWSVLLCTGHMLNAHPPLEVFQQLTVHIPCRRYKQYKPIERSAEQTQKQEGFTAYFSTFKAIFFPNSTERNPLLKSKPGIV